MIEFILISGCATTIANSVLNNAMLKMLEKKRLRIFRRKK